jgi:hypothetical protein
VGSLEDRIAENEALFRAMNERLAEWEERQAAPAEKHMFFCECGNRQCRERVCLTVAEYRSLRESPVRFAVLPGHVVPAVERVVEKREGYVVVEKEERFQRVIEQAPERWTVEPDGGPPGRR